MQCSIEEIFGPGMDSRQVDRGGLCLSDWDCVLDGSMSTHMKVHFWGWQEDMPSRQHTESDSAECRTGMMWMPVGVYYMGCTLAPPGEHDWTVRLLRWFGLMPDYFDHYCHCCYWWYEDTDASSPSVIWMCKLSSGSKTLLPQNQRVLNRDWLV